CWAGCCGTCGFSADSCVILISAGACGCCTFCHTRNSAPAATSTIAAATSGHNMLRFSRTTTTEPDALRFGGTLTPGGAMRLGDELRSGFSDGRLPVASLLNGCGVLVPVLTANSLASEAASSSDGGVGRCIHGGAPSTSVSTDGNPSSSSISDSWFA